MSREVKVHPTGFDGKAFDAMCRKRDDELLNQYIGSVDPTIGQVSDAIESWLDRMVIFPPGTQLSEGDSFWHSYREHLKSVGEGCLRLKQSGLLDGDSVWTIALDLLHHGTTPDKLAALRRCAERLRTGSTEQTLPPQATGGPPDKKKRQLKRKNKGGRPKVDETEANKRREFCENWQDAKEGKRSFSEYCQDEKVSEKEGRAYLQWVADNPENSTR